jgi:hypothetical protein
MVSLSTACHNGHTPDFDFTQHRARGGQCPERTSCEFRRVTRCFCGGPHSLQLATSGGNMHKCGVNPRSNDVACIVFSCALFNGHALCTGHVLPCHTGCLPNSFVEDAFRILVAHSPPSLRSANSLLLTVRCLRVIWCGLSVRINAHWRPESLCQLMACL